MPRKIRQLIKDLRRADFENRGGKGSHRNFVHPTGVRLTLSGNEGDDALRYQERDVERAIREAKERSQTDEQEEQQDQS
jgi:predicted RNA binding protein YcfA (HicA-like mRNA interferase family)